tara:strand:- start:178 stop:519 length:342 start_codon:yes stop_codon:yes gene_type:complete
MIKKSLILSLGIFLILMTFASTVKHRTRDLEKQINKTNKEILILKKQLNDAQTDFIYLSNPEKLMKNLSFLKKEEYIPYDYSRIFLSTDDFLINSSNETKLIKEKNLNEEGKK